MGGKIPNTIRHARRKDIRLRAKEKYLQYSLHKYISDRIRTELRDSLILLPGFISQ